MPFALTFIGLVMVITGVKGTQSIIAAQLRTDAIPFMKWATAIFMVGAVGYWDKARPFANLFMTLVILGLLLSNKGFFAKLQEAINQGPEAMPDPCSGTGGAGGTGTGRKASITVKSVATGQTSTGSFDMLPDVSSMLPDSLSDVKAGDIVKFLPYILF